MRHVVVLPRITYLLTNWLSRQIPNNVAYGTAECLARCGIRRTPTQPTSQRQPRLASNPLPPGYSGPPPPPPPPATPPLAGSLDHNETDTTSPTLIPQSGAILNTGLSSVWRDKQVQGFFVALLVINGAFAVGALVALFLWVARTRGPKHAPLASRDAPAGQFHPIDKVYYDPYDPRRSPSPATPERNANL